MSDIPKGEAHICWTLQIRCGPDTPIVETEVVGDRIKLSAFAPETTIEEIGEAAFAMLGQQFLESFLVMTGVGKPNPSGYGVEGIAVNVVKKELAHV